MRKNTAEAYKDKLKILMAIEARDTVDRTLLYALFPDISYGTVSGRLADLLKAGLIKEAGTVSRKLNETRRVFGLPRKWNPVASPESPVRQGLNVTKTYVKTSDWGITKALKAMSIKRKKD